MKLLIITQVVDKDHPILGFFHRWIKEFAKCCDTVYVICLQEGKHNLPNNVIVMSLGKEKRRSRILYLVNFYRFIFKSVFIRRVDRIFVHMNEIYILLLTPLLPVLKLKGVELTWWKAHGHLGKLTKMTRFVPDKIFTSSAGGFSIDTPKRYIVGQGIDTDFFSFCAEGHDMQKIISVGRLSPVKHHEEVIEVVGEAKKQGLSLKAAIIGPTDEKRPDYKETLVNMIRQKGLSDQVQILSAQTQTEMRETYRTAGFIINASDTDSLDKVVLEAMACGVIPVTSTKAYESVLSPFGLFVPKRDIPSIVSAMKYVYDMSAKGQNDLRHKLRSIVERRHSLSSLVNKIIKI